MVEMFPLRSEDAAYNKIKGMLSSLGDPFTRIISPKVLILRSCITRLQTDLNWISNSFVNVIKIWASVMKTWGSLNYLVFSVILFFIHIKFQNDFSWMQEYQSFRIGTDGNLQGVGLFINVEPKTGHLVGNKLFVFFFNFKIGSLFLLLYLCGCVRAIQIASSKWVD